MKILDKILFIYTLLFSTTIFVTNITRISNTTTAIPVLLFLPVLIYLAYQLVTGYYERRYAPPKPPVQPDNVSNIPRFNIFRFLSQGGFSFSLSLVIFLLCLVTFISRAYLSSYNPKFISPQPLSAAPSLHSYVNPYS